MLREALAKNPTLEVRRRLELVQASFTLPLPAGEALRGIRAVAVLERIGTPQARG